MLRGFTENPNYAFSADNSALVADWLDGRAYLHSKVWLSAPTRSGRPLRGSLLTVARYDPAFGEIVWSKLHGNGVSLYEANLKFEHLTGNVGTDNHTFEISGETDVEEHTREGFDDYTVNFDFIAFGT